MKISREKIGENFIKFNQALNTESKTAKYFLGYDLKITPIADCCSKINITLKILKFKTS